MNEPTVAHDTIALSRELQASPAEIFAAFQSAEARNAWGAPWPGVTLVHEGEPNFSTNGEDVVICQKDGKPEFWATTRYHVIEEDQRLLFTQTISVPEKVFGTSLVTVEVTPASGKTRLSLTVQVAALDGSGLEGGGSKQPGPTPSILSVGSWNAVPPDPSLGAASCPSV